MPGAGSVPKQALIQSPHIEELFDQYNLLLADVDKIWKRLKNRLQALNGATIADGTTVGKLKTVGGTIEYVVDGEHFSKAATDDLWNLAAEVDTAAAQYVAFWLYLDAAGAASYTRASAVAASAAAAKAVLLADGEPAASKAVIGVFVAGPETDFSAEAIAAQVGATIEYGIPADMVPSPTAYAVTRS